MRKQLFLEGGVALAKAEAERKEEKLNWRAPADHTITKREAEYGYT